MKKEYCTTPDESTSDGLCDNYAWENGKCVTCLISSLKEELSQARKLIGELVSATEKITGTWCIKPECRCYLCEVLSSNKDLIEKLTKE